MIDLASNQKLSKNFFVTTWVVDTIVFQMSAPVDSMADLTLFDVPAALALQGRRFLGNFYKPLLGRVENDQLYIVVRDDDEEAGPLIREARLLNVYPNVNTGWPTYHFEYTRVLRGTDNPHAMAVRIGRDEYYSLYQ